MHARISFTIVTFLVCCSALADEKPVSRILFGSCCKQQNPAPIFDKIVEQDPELFIFLGDNIYGDTTDMKVMQAKYDQLAAKPGFAKLMKACPILATWDDHDYGMNDGGASYSKRDESQKLFVDFWRDPADSPRRKRAGVYDAKIMGPKGKRLQVILLDTRYFRSALKTGERRTGGPYYPSDDKSKTMLGEAQWKWLEEQLRQPAEVRVIASSIQCVAQASGQESWSNLPHERQRLFDLIAKTKASGVVIMSGDRHWSEFSAVSDDVPYPIYDVTSSSFNQPHPRGTPTLNRFRAIDKTYHHANFGALQIDWEREDPRIKMQVLDVNAKPQIEKWLDLSQLTASSRKASRYKPPYSIELQAAHSGYNRERCWVHTRAGIVPSKTGKPFSAVLTMHELRITGSDVYYPIQDLRSDDGGKTWSKPNNQDQAFARRDEPGGVEEGISDFWPTWHEKSGVLLGTGHTIRYIGDNLQPHPRPRDTVYSTYDPKSRKWSEFRAIKTPDDEMFFMDGAGSTQRVDLENGEILLPVYTLIRETAKGRFNSQGVAFVMRCSFDGKTLKYIEHGDKIAIPEARGFTEPSLVRFGGKFLMTLRNDEHNYVTRGKDGLHFEEEQRLKFDDGEDLGSYNTQTHWLTLGKRLYLVYTRRGAHNDHVFRHRAPLFIAEFDPDKMRVLRDTEQVVVPERGARLGNFGITRISENESWVTVAEWMQSIRPHAHDPTQCEKFGSNNSIFVAKIRAK